MQPRPDPALLPRHLGHALADLGLDGHARAGVGVPEDLLPRSTRLGIPQPQRLFLPAAPRQHVQEATADRLALHRQPRLGFREIVINVVQFPGNDVDNQPDELHRVRGSDVCVLGLEGIPQGVSIAQYDALLLQHFLSDPVHDLWLLHFRLYPLLSGSQHLSNLLLLLLVGNLFHAVDDSSQHHFDGEEVFLLLHLLLHLLVVV
mmetsp:Transcript_33511/g.56206  ORF Transcript_33511/g.56206 Transcript_33511/m.56206 type:complete len:204 (+) Transcript_33511:906-1517(+)